MRKRTIICEIAATFVLALAGLAATASAQPPTGQPKVERFGAIAYSPSTRRFGSSWNHADQTSAENAAMNMCNRRDCQILLPLTNSCGALAVARNGGYVWAGGDSLYNAKLSASNRCTAEHGSCKLICSICSSGNTP